MRKTDWQFRTAVPEDLAALFEIEEVCFPPKERLERESLEARLLQCPDRFLLCTDPETGAVCGYVGGICAEEPVLTDEMFTGRVRHAPEGRHLMILGLEVRPAYRKQGMAAALLRRFLDDARSEGLESCVLTCRDYLVPYYEGFGFRETGVSGSVWGGVTWYDMSCPL